MLAVDFVMGSFSEFITLLLRLSGIFVLAPALSNTAIPMRVRGGAVFAITLIAFPVLTAQGVLPAPTSFTELVAVGLGELFIGVLIGFMVSLVLAIFQMSGQFYSIQMGFGIINVFDPMAQTSVPIISQLKSLIMTMLFLLIGGHHLVFEAVFKSYLYLPTVYGADFSAMARMLVYQFDKMFFLGFLIGIPLIGVVFLMTMSLGILSKLAPQLNVMILGFGLKVLVGITTFIFLAPAFVRVAMALFEEIFNDITRLLVGM